MMAEARKIAAVGENVVVKIPMTKEGMHAVSELSKAGIKTNVTLVFSASQALIAAKAGASYVSPFIGRLDDIGEDGMILIKDIITIFRNYSIQTKVLAHDGIVVAGDVVSPVLRALDPLDQVLLPVWVL